MRICFLVTNVFRSPMFCTAQIHGWKVLIHPADVCELSNTLFSRAKAITRKIEHIATTEN